MSQDAFGSLDLFSAFNDKAEEKKQTYHNAVENGDEEHEIAMSAEVALLRAENIRLKSRLRLYERFGHLFPSQTPLAEIDYFKSPLSVECQARIESELFTVLSENRDTTEEVGAGDDCGPYGQVLYLPYYIIDSVGKFWDTTPVQYGDNTPLFTNMFKVALDDSEDKLDMFGAKLPKENTSNGPECFNCDGPHRLSDCKQPRDKKKIQEALKLFKESRGGPNHNDRYHVRVVKEIEDKFKEFLPGKISDNLKVALGMENHELPPHIYRMRTFGYPPGYSLDPPVANSEGLQMYYKPTGSREDGELEEVPLPSVIEYPGYTAPLLPDTIDKVRSRMPYTTVTPTLSDRRKPKVDNSKRRKLNHTLGEDDMDVDDDKPEVKVEPAYSRAIIKQPPLPIHPPPPATPTPPPPAPPPAQPLPPGTEDLVDITEEKPKEKKPSSKEGAGSSKELAEEEGSKEEGEVTEEVEVTKEPPPRAMTVVSETNKIGIKFDQVDDYGPLDERAGNFNKLQCILRSKRRSISKTPNRGAPNTKGGTASTVTPKSGTPTRTGTTPTRGKTRTVTKKTNK